MDHVLLGIWFRQQEFGSAVEVNNQTGFDFCVSRSGKWLIQETRRDLRIECCHDMNKPHMICERHRPLAHHVFVGPQHQHVRRCGVVEAN